MNVTSLRLQVIKLAGGFSSRLGQPKALARVHGVSLLRRTLELAATLKCAKIIAVVGRNSARHRAQAGAVSVTFVANSRRNQGLSSSVRLGIAKARHSPAVLLMPVDLANLYQIPRVGTAGPALASHAAMRDRPAHRPVRRGTADSAAPALSSRTRRRRRRRLARTDRAAARRQPRPRRFAVGVLGHRHRPRSQSRPTILSKPRLILRHRDDDRLM